MDEQEEALRARATARLGTTLLGKYRLDRIVGIGGMATVFAATHRNQAELAVKLLHPELSLREDLRKRFLREGYVGNSVKHPGAVLVVDDDVGEDGSAFLVMELLRGRSLEDVWERSNRKLPSRVVAALTCQLLEVLMAAHDKAIVHRDLKPANLFLTHDGSLKVLDFGIARLRDSVGGDSATRTGTLMGTPAFMAPEQAQAVAAEIDGQTDLWAVGATMYTLLSGQLVHDGDNSSQLLIRAGTTRARPLSTVAPTVEPAIAAVVDRALAFEKSGRWPTAEAMRDALLAAGAQVHGRTSARESLIPLAEPEGRVPGSAQTERAPDGIGSGQPTPRLVVPGDAGIRGIDPTYATPVEPRPAGRAPTPAPRLMGPVTSTAVSSSDSRPVLPGLSTANPVSAEASTVRRPKPSTPPLRLAVVAIALLGAVGLAFALSRPHSDNTSAVGAASVVSPSPLPSGVASTVAPPPTAAAPSTPPTPPVVEPAPLVSAVVASPPASAAAAVKPQAKTPKSANHPSKANVDCSEPYTFTPDGRKQWKHECLPE